MHRLILLPGLAANEVMWRSQLEALAQWHPVVSDAHTRQDTIEAMATTLLEEHAGSLILCGASMGGMVAMEAARQAPARVAGMALLGTNARPEDDRMREIRERAIALFEQGRVAEVIEPNIALAFHPERALDTALTQSYLDFVLGAGAEQLIRQNRAVMTRPDARRHLPQLRMPSLVMCGDNDQLAPLECSQEIVRLLPAAQLRVVPRCGHMLTMERPDEVNAALTHWLASLRRSD
jgi:pimeloyl-ACP methyl ester carboxylesterase